MGQKQAKYDKFKDVDRERVVDALKVITHAHDAQLAFGDKCWRFDSTFYCVHGGVGLYHGIPKALMDFLDDKNKKQSEIFLIFAWKHAENQNPHYDLYKAPYRMLIEHKDCLQQRQQTNGDYDFHFNIGVVDDGKVAPCGHPSSLCIKEYDRFREAQSGLPDLDLTRFAEVPMSPSSAALTPPRITSTITPDITPASSPDDVIPIFLDPTVFAETASLLQRKRNLILEGPPGVGKTFIAKRLAIAVADTDGLVRTIQFHQSYSYEDFVRGFRPREDGHFELKDGVFLKFCQEAQKDPENDHVLIIDEINRGNISRVFGELLVLIESDKRSPEWTVQLAYPRDGEEPFFVPENVFIIGLMNTADRSLAMMDYALRRRFAFVTLKPLFNDEFRRHLRANGVADPIVQRIVQHVNEVNEVIKKDRDLGPGFCIGHSYFCPDETGEEYDDGWYNDVIDHNIAPLLREYWFDDAAKAARIIGMLRGDSSEPSGHEENG